MYRIHASDLEPPPDPEELAMRDFGRRVSRSRGAIAGVGALLGQVLGLLCYLWLRDLQLGHQHVHVPLLTALLGYGPPFLASLAISGWLGRRWVRGRAGAWIAQLAAHHRVAPERLREYSQVW